MNMRDRLDTLIAERAPWLFQPHSDIRVAKGILDTVLGYDRTLAIATALTDMPGPKILRSLSRLLIRHVDLDGIANIPATGPALVVANHPTGIADGLALYRILERRRPDTVFFANADVLRIVPQLESNIIPVEWLPEKRSHSKARVTMERTRAAIADGRLCVIFPSGRLAKRRGLRLVERPWMASAAMIARKFELPIVPVQISARNSALFYGFDLIHPTLRDITLFHETLNKTRCPFKVTVGPPIAAADLPACSEAAIDVLRAATLSLGETSQQGQSVLRPPSPAAFFANAARGRWIPPRKRRRLA